MLMSTLMNCGEESAIRACAGRVLPLLPDLWAATSGEILIRPHILGVVKGIVIAAGRDSAVLWSFVLPIVSYSVNTAEDEHLSLAGDALELWQHVVGALS